ncbi:ABC transporter substrate-binding protein [Bacillus suaedaesalsae]|uniref:ABC transporter substrate-binding protein n=1 Tax=Bacillus suaedaesalsae TaxID=2810349 RepID=A0ABS2DEJ4_9BACI|nr:ABC transporter substrate-binding protein [Bacillus suaedaesalsae]MBM6616872.1 ABC transporter substrate-binding protein [Bacillus suaedaesalsae]
MTSTTRRGKGMIYVVDPSPLNWLYVLFNTMEEAVRASRTGKIIPSLASRLKWINEKTLELQLRDGVTFQNGEEFTANHVKQNFNQEEPWIAPHPPGTWLNLVKGRKVEFVDLYKVHIHFPSIDGLALGKLRSYHFANHLFWQKLGFGYEKFGTAEGHW